MMGSRRAVLGIDLGTSYFKAGLFSPEGDLLGLARAAVKPSVSPDGRCELSPARFITLVRDAVSEALQHARLAAPDIAAVSYASQANSFTLLDGDGSPLTPLILWSDTRVKALHPLLEQLRARPDLLSVTGMDSLNPGLAVSKLLRIRESEPETWRRARAFAGISDYFSRLATGLPHGDAGTASLLGVWDLSRGRLWTDALDALGFPVDFFSGLYPPGTVIGRTAGRAAELFGLPEGVPFAVGGLDHHMAAVGSGIGALAAASESTGTVLACIRELSRFEPRAGCAMGPGTAGSEAPFYQLAFSDLGSFFLLEWYRAAHVRGLSFDDLVSEAALVPAGSDGLLCLPDAHLAPGLSGFRGAGARNGRGPFARAILECIGAQTRVLLETLYPDALPATVLSTGGGTQSALALQIKADVCGSRFLVPSCTEAACMGAGLLAARAAGWFDSLREACRSWIRSSHVVEPRPEAVRFYREWREGRAAALA